MPVFFVLLVGITNNSVGICIHQLLAFACLFREIGIEADSGIDGILSRLEKERSSSFGINLGMPEYLTHAPGDNGHFGTSRDVGKSYLFLSFSLQNLKGTVKL